MVGAAVVGGAEKLELADKLLLLPPPEQANRVKLKVNRTNDFVMKVSDFVIIISSIIPYTKLLDKILSECASKESDLSRNDLMLKSSEYDTLELAFGYHCRFQPRA